MVLAAAALSAALASGGTAAFLLGSVPAAAPAGTAVATTVAESTPGSATLTRVDAGEAIATVAAAAEQSVVTIAANGGRFASAGGSGVVVSADGLILTTTVAVPTDSTYTVLFADDRERAARVVASDESHGLVLLRVDATDLVPASLARAGTLTVGQLVVAVGSPLGEFTDTVTAGIVSGLDRSIDMRDPSTGRRVVLDGLVQTDAAINAGSSGGPLFDAAGTVVGIVVTSASNGRGIGFAIPVTAARDLVADALAS
jgi:S1-C subfamily serine protease